MTYYFTDKELLNLNFLKRTSYENFTNLAVNLTINIRGYPVLHHVLTNFAYTSKASCFIYKWVTMSKNFSLESIIPTGYIYGNFRDDIKIQLTVTDTNLDSDRNIIPVKVKQFYYTGHEEKTIICSKAYYLTGSLSNDFEFWIELSKYQGYDKLVLYNNSIENTLKYRQVISRNQGFIELIDYQCLPNFYEIDGTPEFIDFEYIETFLDTSSLNHQIFFEKITQNECYWENKDKYKNIAVLDHDEAVIPIALRKKNWLESEISSLLNRKTSKCASRNINSYLRFLKKELRTVDPVVSFHFLMGVYVGNGLVDLILNEVAAHIANITRIMDVIRVPVFYLNDKNPMARKGLNFTVLILNTENLEYARYLVKLWLDVIKPFLNANKFVLHNLSETFCRFFTLTGSTTNWMWGNYNFKIEFFFI